MYGASAGDSLIWKIEARDFGRSAEGGGSYVVASDTLTVTIPGNGAPRVNAGSNIISLSNEKVTLVGIILDPNNDHVSHEWIQVSGPTVVYTQTTGYSLEFTTPTVTKGEQVLVFKLSATDGVLTGEDTVSVTVQNSRPTADAGLDQIVTNGTSVTLDARGSSDRDGSLSYLWEQVSGIMVNFNNSRSIEFSAPASASDLAFKLIVNDTQYDATDSVSVRVVENSPPNARILPVVDVEAGEIVILNGSRTTDRDNDRLTYKWTQTEGETVIISNARSPTASFIVPVVMNDIDRFAKFQLSVFDGIFTNVDTVSVYFHKGSPPHAYAFGHVAKEDENVYTTGFMPDGADYAAPRGVVFVLNGSSSTGLDGLTYEWRQISGVDVQLNNAYEPAATFKTEIGSYASLLEFELSVSDTIGNSDKVRLVIAIDGIFYPVADAGRDIEVRPGTTVILNGSASIDPAGGDLVYLWTQTVGETVNLVNSTEAVATFTAPATTNVTKTLSFSLTVEAYPTLDKDEVNVHVVPQGMVELTLPVADAGTNQSVEPGVLVNLDGGSSYDPDSNTLRYLWTQTSGTDVSLSGMSGPTPSFRSPNVMQEVLIFELTVTDGDGNVGTDSVSVTVVFLEPDADAGADQSVKSGTYVRLDGSGSIEGLGHADYLWTQTSGGIVEIEDIDSSIAAFVSPDSDAVLTFKLTVTNGAYSDSDTITVTIDGNDAPNVGVGATKYVKSGEKVDLRGFVDDPDNTELSYQWSHESGPNVFIYDDRTLTPYFIAPNVSGTQTIVIKLVVMDNEGGTNSDTININVRENQSPVIVLEKHLFVVAGERVILDASGSYDPDNDDLSYEWIADFGPEVLILGSGERVSFIAPVVSDKYENTVYMILEVTDGALTDVLAFQIDITNNNKPVVNVDQSSIRVASNSTFTLSGTLNDSDEDTNVWWSQTDGISTTSIDSFNDGDTFTRTDRAPIVESGTTVLTFRFAASDDDWLVEKIVTVTVYAP